MTINPDHTTDQHPDPKPPGMFHRLVVLITAAGAGAVTTYFSDWESGLTVFTSVCSVLTIERGN